MFLALLLLVSGLTISAVAIYYSVIGLAAIFAGATLPIYIMGISLEVAKLVGASWLKAHWKRAPSFLKMYMAASILVLMLITSMGIFGFLSKSHLEQAVPTGSVVEKVKLLDEKIAIERDEIAASRAALQQLDNQVTELLARSNDTAGANRAVLIRKQQAGERKQLQSAIAASQTTIDRLQTEKAPLASKLRQVEAEVGPLKYIAALVYGGEPDASTLEKAVTWMIILIVAVFDPLAVSLLLAAQVTFNWYRADKKYELKHANFNSTSNHDVSVSAGSTNANTNVESVDSVVNPAQLSEAVAVSESADVVQEEHTIEESTPKEDAQSIDFSKLSYLQDKFHHFRGVLPIVHKDTNSNNIQEDVDYFEDAVIEQPVSDATETEDEHLIDAQAELYHSASEDAAVVVQQELADSIESNIESDTDANVIKLAEAVEGAVLAVEPIETSSVFDEDAATDNDVIINTVGQSKKKFMIKQAGQQVAKTLS